MSWNTSPPTHLHSPAIELYENRPPQFQLAFAPSGSIQYSPEVHRLAAVVGQQYATSVPTGTVPVYAPNAVDAVPAPEEQQDSARPLPSDVQDMQFWDEIWPRAIEQLKNDKEAVDPGREKLQFSMRNCNTWKEVADKLSLARAEYDGKDDNWTGKLARDVKKAGRKIGKTVASPVKKVIKVVPENTIATPVLGVVSLLMDAWQEAAKVSDEVSSNMDDLSTGALFEDMDLYCELFRTDQNISKAVEDLLLTVFKAVEGAIGFYISHQVQRFVGYVVKGEEYKAALRKNLAKIKTDSKNLDKQAKKSFMFRMLQERNKPEKTPVVMVHATNNFFYMISDYQRPIFHQQQTYLSIPGPSRTPNPISTSGISTRSSNSPFQTECTPQDLCTIIDAPFGLEMEDMQAIFGCANTMDAEDRGRAEQVISTLQFRSWMYRYRTARLMIQGDFDSPSFASPLSVLCGTLVQALRAQPRLSDKNIIGLVFFCGRHARDSDDKESSAGVSTLPGAELLLRSLISQLLLQCPQVCPSTLPPFEYGELDYLCLLFYIMVSQLPATTTLMIFVDGFSFYLSDRYWEDMEDVLSLLLSWVVDEEDGEGVQAQSMSCSVRLLLTCSQPPRPRRFVRLFRGHETVLHLENVQDWNQGPSKSGITGQLEKIMSLEDEEDHSG